MAMVVEYDFAKHWGAGIEMFGEIEDLSHAGSFNRQNHSIGPTLFWSPTKNEEDVGDAAGGDEAKAKAVGTRPSDCRSMSAFSLVLLMRHPTRRSNFKVRFRSKAFLELDASILGLDSSLAHGIRRYSPERLAPRS